MSKPVSIRYFDYIFWAGLVLGLVALAVAWPSLIEGAIAELVAERQTENLAAVARTAIIAGAALNVAVFGALWFLVSRKRVSWARWVLLALALYGIFASIRALMIGQQFGLFEAISLLSNILTLVAAGLLFRADSRVWFARNADPE